MGFKIERASVYAPCSCCNFEQEQERCLVYAREVGEKVLGYKFKDPMLVVEAFTHPSFHYSDGYMNYQRLEYIGDAVLGCLMAKHFFSSYPELPPGDLTRLRAANVDREKLARAAVVHDLYRFLRLRGAPWEAQFEEFKGKIQKYPVHSNGLLETPKVLSDIVEALLGAVFVDSCYDLDAVAKVYKGLLEPVISPQTLMKHPMSELLELCQKKVWGLKFRRQACNNLTKVDVVVKDHLIARASSHKGEIAQNRAAKAALDKLKSASPETDLDFEALSKALLSMNL